MKTIETKTRAKDTKPYSSPKISCISIRMHDFIAASTAGITSDYDEVTYEGADNWI